MTGSWAITLMPDAPSVWTLAQLMGTSGISWDAAKYAVSNGRKLGTVEVIRRGSIHGCAIYRRAANRTPTERVGAIVTPAANSVFNIAA